MAAVLLHLFIVAFNMQNSLFYFFDILTSGSFGLSLVYWRTLHSVFNFKLLLVKLQFNQIPSKLTKIF